MKEYDVEIEERDKNEDDRIPMNYHERIRPCDGRIGRGFVQNLLDQGGVNKDIGNMKMQISAF